jgi:hypothetical protein
MLAVEPHWVNWVVGTRAFFDMLKAVSTTAKGSSASQSVPASQAEAILACLTAAPKYAPSSQAAAPPRGAP